MQLAFNRTFVLALAMISARQWWLRFKKVFDVRGRRGVQCINSQRWDSQADAGYHGFVASPMSRRAASMRPSRRYSRCPEVNVYISPKLQGPLRITNPDPPSPDEVEMAPESWIKHAVLTIPLQEAEGLENGRSMSAPIAAAKRYNGLAVGSVALGVVPQLESIDGEPKKTHTQHNRLTVGTSTWPNLTDGIREGLSSKGIHNFIA